MASTKLTPSYARKNKMLTARLGGTDGRPLFRQYKITKSSSRNNCPWCEPGRWGRKPAHRSANAHVSRVRVDLHGANDHGPCARIHVDEHASTNLVTHARR